MWGAGVGAPAPGGILWRELLDALKSLRGGFRLLVMEIFEYNSYRETPFKTAQAVRDLCVSVARLR
ncbi:MAG TPA: arginase family protein [Thiobacillaceae bacterium]|nr:arginase family protein [Thiobacillaceae bacterium]